jgi:hypothetical protein
VSNSDITQEVSGDISRLYGITQKEKNIVFSHVSTRMALPCIVGVL